VHHTYDPKNIDLKPVAEFTELDGLFKLDIPNPTEQTSIAARVTQTMGRLNQRLIEQTMGAIDFQSVAFLGLLGMTFFQLRRRVIMTPAITALWYASSILKDMKTKKI
jgi:hypothetical protein